MAELDPQAFGVIGAQLEQALNAGHADEAACAELEMSALVSPTPAAWYAAANILAGAGHHHAASRAATRVIALAPASEQLHYLCGGLHYERQQYAAAAACFRVALALRPGWPDANFYLGRSFAYTDRHEDALAPLRSVLAFRPDWPEAHFYLGISHVALGGHAAARPHLERAAALKPDWAQASLGLGRVLAHLGEHEAAVDALSRALTLDLRSSDAVRLLAENQIRLRRFGDAELVLREAVRFDPDRLDAQLLLGRVLGVLGKNDESEAIFKAVLTHRPRHVGARGEIEIIGLRRARHEAEELYRERSPLPVAPVKQPPAPHTSSAIGLREGLAVRILRAHVAQVPFRHFHLTGILPDEIYDQLIERIAAFDGWTWGSNKGYPDRANASLDEIVRGSPPLTELAQALQSAELRDALVAALGASGERALTEAAGYRLRTSYRLTRDRSAYALGPHRDHVARFASLLIYLPSRRHKAGRGTSIFRPKQAPAFDDHGIHMPFEQFEKVATIPFTPNSAMGFLNFGDAYHGVEIGAGEEWRDVLQGTVYIEPIDGPGVSDPER